MNIQSKQGEFMAMSGQRIATLREVLRSKRVPADAALYMNLNYEEDAELKEWFDKYANAIREDEKLACLCELLDAICDSIVTRMGLCNALGLPFEAAYEEVHKSNMNKFVDTPEGPKILKRVDGKVIKPAHWKKPDLMSILRYHLIQGL